MEFLLLFEAFFRNCNIDSQQKHWCEKRSENISVFCNMKNLLWVSFTRGFFLRADQKQLNIGNTDGCSGNVNRCWILIKFRWIRLMNCFEALNSRVWVNAIVFLLSKLSAYLYLFPFLKQTLFHWFHKQSHSKFNWFSPSDSKIVIQFLMLCILYCLILSAWALDHSTPDRIPRRIICF